MKTYTVKCVSEAISPITHASGTAGNESIVAREPVLTDRGIVYVPFLSGNALRHRCVREPMALWLIDRYGLQNQLSLQQVNFLLHGGNLTMSTGSENTRRIAEMHEYWPLLRLCGGSLPDQILAGSMDVWRGTLVCEENRRLVEVFSGEPADARMLSCERFLGGYQYTRGDAKKLGIERDRSDVTDDSNLMIYSGQSVSRGAMFIHGFVLKHVNEIELGCLLLSLSLWQSNGGTIGGNARLGHGRLKTSVIDVANQHDCVNAYVEHVDRNRENAIRWLCDAFTPKAELKAKRKAKVTTDG